MIHELVVENYAVVERVRIHFHSGFNLLTGETGSGKSIVVDALGLLFGGRASADMIRAGADRARISGIFDAPAGMNEEDDEILIEREILANGKSRAFLNSRPVTATVLRDLSIQLGDIHGQHDQQRLFEEDMQREILDSFGSVSSDATAKAYEELRAVQAELNQLEKQEQERLQLADLWSFQKKEIEAVGPKAGEDAELEQSKKMLANVARLQQSAGECYTALYEAPESALTGLRTAIRRLDDLCRIDSSLEETLESMRSADIALNEAANAVRDYLDRLEADPQRLEEVESRLASLDRLKRKYGPSVDELLSYLEQIRVSLSAAESAEDRSRELRERIAVLSARYEEVAAKLTAERRKVAKKLESAVEKELKPLAMESARFVVSLEKSTPSASGSDRVVFLVSPNLGEEPRPMEKVLSGGELSRMALALKCLTSTGPTGRTLVFDEVDAGIGGAVAESIGRRLKRVASENQVLCVTHLAQIAGFGDHHYTVEKGEREGRTVASVTELSREERIQEIGRMLAGNRLTPEVLKHAEQLLDVQ